MIEDLGTSFIKRKEMFVSLFELTVILLSPLEIDQQIPCYNVTMLPSPEIIDKARYEVPPVSSHSAMLLHYYNINKKAF